MTRTFSIDRARRLALGAQGFGDKVPTGRVDVRHFRRVIDRLKIVQLDSVNVYARSHYMPFLSRLGPYDRDALDHWLWRSGENFEYIGHEAVVSPIGHYPLFGHRRATGRWNRGRRFEAERPEYLQAVLAEVAAHGPLSIKELSDPGERRGAWWGYADGKIALEWLYQTGRLAVAERADQFVIYYDLPERVIPDEHRHDDVMEADAIDRLLLMAAEAHGIATAIDLADYFRLSPRTARPAVARLAEEAKLVEVRVEGWKDPAFTVPGVKVPRRIDAQTFLSPFDPIVWFRPRAERLFDFHYRIEIYVPAEKRIHGYYVLPFLLGDRIVARADLKADRKAGVLRVPGAFCEHDAEPLEVAEAMADSLRRMAEWSGLDTVEIGTHGDLAPPLAERVR